MRAWITIALMLLNGCGLLDPGVSAPDGDPHAQEGAPAADLFTCGMHPNVIQEGPGLCPICKMDLTPLKPTDGTVTELQLEAGVVQNMGVRLATVTRGELDRGVRTVGEIAVAEDEFRVVNLRFDGWVERLFVSRTGDEVHRGQPLLDVYSPELVSAQDEYLLARRTSGEDTALARSARARLEHLGMGAGQIDAIAAAGQASRVVTVYAPAAGHVLHKDVWEGSAVTAGADLFHIGDLSRIWVLAEVYEFDAPWVAEGQSAVLEASHAPGVRYLGTVDHVYPTLDERTRTLRVRMIFDNPELALRPGMFATVTLRVQGRQGVLKVPTEAILRSADSSSVYVSEGDGLFRAVEVLPGLVGDGETEILAGLDEGQEIVLSGQFLLDSESQLRQSTADLLSRRGHEH